MAYPSNSGSGDSGSDVGGSGGSGSGDDGSGNGGSAKGGKNHNKNDDVAPTSFCQCYSKIDADSLPNFIDQPADITCSCFPVLSGPAADGPTKDLCPSFSGTFTDEKNSDGNPVPWVSDPRLGPNRPRCTAVPHTKNSVRTLARVSLHLSPINAAQQAWLGLPAATRACLGRTAPAMGSMIRMRSKDGSGLSCLSLLTAACIRSIMPL